ncbi:hypothetical protein HDV06_002804 [Boothiomyces sp. JEL0866]|nr:hypothetical protein HDV06_002804 [Boothiomyces sp. JEL0866]
MIFASLLYASVAPTATKEHYFGNNPFQESISYTPGAHSMINPITLHIVWYGTNWKPSQKSIITDFLSGLDQSDIWSIAHAYYNTDVNGMNKVYVSKTLTLGHQVNDAGSFGKYLNNATYLNENPTTAYANDIPYIINNFIKKGQLPFDTNALYLVLSDDQTVEGTSCSSYCGYHFSVLSDQYAVTTSPPEEPGVMDPAIPNIKYAWIGNPFSCGPAWAYSCSTRNRIQSPNGDIGVDMMLSPLFHEIAEASSNPDPVYSAWLSPDQYENGDNCAYIFGAQTKQSYGIYSNEHWNGRSYLIQSLWDQRTQFCGPIYPSLVPVNECKAVQKLFPTAVLGNDCCSSGFVSCSNGHVDGIFGYGNNLNGTIADAIKFVKANFPMVSQIDFSWNNFVGPIPNDVCTLTLLEQFTVSGNSGITGAIPSCIGNLVNLQELSFGFTGVSGGLPSGITKLQKLRYFNLGNTTIAGPLPQGFGSLNNLNLLSLSNTKLSGPFPNGLSGFGGKSVQPMGVVCDASGSKLCLPPYHVGPTCGLSPC